MSSNGNTDQTTPRNFRLDSLDALRRFHGRILNEVRNGQLDAVLGSKLSYMVNIHAGLLKDGDLETRLTELEQRLHKEVRQ